MVSLLWLIYEGANKGNDVTIKNDYLVTTGYLKRSTGVSFDLYDLDGTTFVSNYATVGAARTGAATRYPSMTE